MEIMINLAAGNFTVFPQKIIIFHGFIGLFLGCCWVYPLVN
jgi:hypothetical protein